MPWYLPELLQSSLGDDAHPAPHLFWRLPEMIIVRKTRTEKASFVFCKYCPPVTTGLDQWLRRFRGHHRPGWACQYFFERVDNADLRPAGVVRHHQRRIVFIPGIAQSHVERAHA